MEIGKLIKTLRINKNISAKEVYTGVMSRSAYERFEKGAGDTSTDHFFEILSRLNIDQSDIVLMPTYVNFGSPYAVKQIHQIFREENQSNETIIEKVANKHLLSFFQLGSSRNDTVNISLYARCLLAILHNQEEMALLYSGPLKNYLSKTETWSNVETIIFSDLAICYPTDMLCGLTNLCISSYRRHRQLSPILVAEMLSSAISVCIYRKEKTLAKQLLKTFEEMIHESEQVENAFAIKYTILKSMVCSEGSGNFSELVPIKAMQQLNLKIELDRYAKVIPELLSNQEFHYL